MIQEIKGTRKRGFWFCTRLSPQGKREAVVSVFIVAEEEDVQVGKTSRLWETLKPGTA